MLLRWVHVAEVDSFLRAYRLYGQRPIDAVDADRYVEQAARVAVALGAERVPTSVTELALALREFRPVLGPSTAAREAADFLLHEPPVPWTLRPAYAVARAGRGRVVAAVGVRAARHPAPRTGRPGRRPPRRGHRDAPDPLDARPRRRASRGGGEPPLRPGGPRTGCVNCPPRLVRRPRAPHDGCMSVRDRVGRALFERVDRPGRNRDPRPHPRSARRPLVRTGLTGAARAR